MRRPTQVDVARLASVSRATISYVINDLPYGVAYNKAGPDVTRRYDGGQPPPGLQG